MPKETGRVVKSVGGYHSVAFADGSEQLLRARGNVKRNGAILPGDLVQVTFTEREAVIESVLPRRSELVRPPVANVELVVVVVSLCDPEPSWDLLDRILALVERERLEAVIVFNKLDLVDAREAERLTKGYRDAGYATLLTSVMGGNGVAELGALVGTRIAVVSGPSGVGKSSLLNCFVDAAAQKTREISTKSKRGRHTTRAVSLLALPGGGWIADSPGFSTLNLGPADPRSVREWYPEFDAYHMECRFSGCFHRAEPGCAVRAAVADGRLDHERYERYLRLLAEVEEAFERRY